MGYDLRRGMKPENSLTEEEFDVQQALREYTADPDVAHPNDFVPTEVLYRIYRDYAARFASDPDAPKPLTKRQFGAALLRVFPDLDERDPELGDCICHVRRTYDGKLKCGYRGLSGPLSQRTQDGPGRPPAVLDEAAAYKGPCRFPNKTASTSYRNGCRCERCRKNRHREHRRHTRVI